MKKIVFAFLLLISIKVNSQNYQPIGFDTTCYWVLSFEYYDERLRVSGEKIATVEKDTSINNTVYSKIFIYPTIVSVNDSFYAGWGYSTDVVFLREDSVFKKIYSYDPSTHLEEVFVDYDLNIGDTLLVSNVFTYKVDSIYTTSILGINRRIQYGSGPQPMNGYTTIEGVGAKFSFPKGGVYGEWGIPFYTLKCFSKGGVTLYGDSNQPCPKAPQIIAAVNEIDNSKIDLAYSSNRIIIKNPNTENVDLDIYEISGRLVEHFNSNERTFTVNIDHLPRGLYIALLKSKTYSLFRKIIVY